ncbi:MAG TPA: RNB domain-containing ribonuclease [Terriglobales bacterium]
MLSDSAILKKIERQPKHTAGFKQLVRELGLHGEERRELSDRLNRMVAGSQLLRLDSDRYAIPQPAKGQNLAVGRLSMHRDGFGFVIPDPSSLDERLKARLSGDIFIPPNAVGSAMNGDRVLVQVGAIRADGRAEGRILRPVNRAHLTVVGTFHYGRRYNYVTPIDAKVTQEIVVPPGREHPELKTGEAADRTEKEDKRSRSAHRVLGDEAARLGDRESLENVVVDVEITDWPTPTQNPRGRVIEVLGRAEDFGVDVEIIIRKYHLPHRFPAEVLEEAQAVDAVISSQEARRRKDFRSVPIVTIDGETARDFDDAVSVRRLDNGNFELQVHIADVAHYVTPGSALDQEARLRSTSVYFPDRAVPMLPLELSTDICSLRPRVDRLVMSCVMEIDHRGEVTAYELGEGMIRSAERMTYTAVNAVLEGDPVTRQRYAQLAPMFELMRDLALILNHKRERRGSIDFDLPEPVIEFDENGLMKGVTRSERNIAHRLIEEFMLAANECVAEHLETRSIASLYRIHEKPDAKRVYEFEIIAATFGYSLGVGALPVQRVQLKTDRRASYGTGKRARELEIPKEVHITPRMYQKLTDKIAGKPEERILSYLMLRSLKQARYSEENLGHFALAAKTYTHFTSPIRRYPDLIVHRILKSSGALGSGAGVTAERSATPWSKRREHTPAAHSGGLISPDQLHDIAEESSMTERRADEAERELMEWKKAKFMQERIGEDFDGLIVSVTKFGFFVELSELFVEGLVPLSSLADDRYMYHENTREIIGQRTRRTFRLGQKLRVLVDRIDPVERKIQFALFEESVPKKPRRRH